jgi:hypothetical protein
LDKLILILILGGIFVILLSRYAGARRS